MVMVVATVVVAVTGPKHGNSDSNSNGDGRRHDGRRRDIRHGRSDRHGGHHHNGGSHHNGWSDHNGRSHGDRWCIVTGADPDTDADSDTGAARADHNPLSIGGVVAEKQSTQCGRGQQCIFHEVSPKSRPRNPAVSSTSVQFWILTRLGPL
jgi:hypothetical protein